MTYLLTRTDGWFQVLDKPNDRSLHHIPTPRTGGIAIWAGLVIGGAATVVFWGSITGFSWLVSAAFLVGSVSFLDDRSHVSVKIRLTAHVAAAGLVLASGVGPWHFELPGLVVDLPLMVAPILWIFFCVWMINLYNFMDGMDGFAGGMAVFGFGSLGLLGLVAGDSQFAALNCVIAAATGGFLVWNFPPARIFMGDTGSSTLGLLAAGLSLWADKNGLFPLWISVIVFSPFIVDASVTLVRRLIRGERVWEAHKTHYYQRLAQTGWGHRRTVLWEYGLMLVCSVAAILALEASASVQRFIVGSIALLYAVAMFSVYLLEIRQIDLRS
jgi:UDP-N-acetylmuramyl pentapeptide phosphotransferase/UDP-N-acetylglucosamine-1-phosphate transferase